LYGGILLNKKSFFLTVDCNFTDWSSWGACDKTCGRGLQERSRQPGNPPPQYGGKECEGPVVEVQECTANVPCRKLNENCVVILNYSFRERKIP